MSNCCFLVLINYKVFYNDQAYFFIKYAAITVHERLFPFTECIKHDSPNSIAYSIKL
jgi:hypothetical protein